jgi:monofunctional biosynthetic peptidoglycan transglycosylase
MQQRSARIGLAAALAALVGFGAGAAWIAYSFIAAPDFTQLREEVTVPIVLANLEKSTRRVGPKAPGWTPYAAISRYLFAAVVASEDGSYYQHDGLDYKELKAAIKKDLEEGRFARGASTITQQVVKNTYLSQEKTITRKIREMIWARALNRTLSKREILTFYVNLVEFGPGIYGVRDAARFYFGKAPSELSPKESAFLAMLLPSPRRYSVSFRQKKLTPYARRRVSQILLIMHKMGVLDEEAYAVARSEALWGVDAALDAVTDKDIANGLEGDGAEESVSDSVTRAGTPRAELDGEGAAPNGSASTAVLSPATAPESPESAVSPETAPESPDSAVSPRASDESPSPAPP